MDWESTILRQKDKIIAVARMAMSFASCMKSLCYAGCILPVYIDNQDDVYIGEDVANYSAILAEEAKGDRKCVFYAHCGQPLYRGHSESNEAEVDEIIWELVKETVNTLA